MRPKINDLAKFLPEDSTGLGIWRNKKNGFCVVDLHYTADPSKRSREWLENERQGMPEKEWAVEYEKSWETYGGTPVYQNEFVKERHVPRDTISPDPDLPLLVRGWDFGGNQSCAITQPRGSRLFVIDELPNGGRNTRKFGADVIAFCNTQYGPRYHYVDVIDPTAMWEGKTSTGIACADVLRDEFHLNVIPAPTNDPLKRIDAVLDLLMGQDLGQPRIQVSQRCVMLITGFQGGYQFPEKETQNQRADRPLKNEYSHIHDALQYAILYVQGVRQPDEEEREEDYYQPQSSRYKFFG